MHCPECNIDVAYDKEKTKDLCECIVCGETLRVTPYDILKKGMHGIVNEVREPQIAMAREIEKVLNDKHEQKTLIAEGGTGIGKSFAYLIPAILQHKSKRIVISTATKALQEQVYNDLVMICDTLQIHTPVKMIKGAGNYGCFKLAGNIGNAREKKEYQDRVNTCIKNNTIIDFSAGDPYDVVPRWASDVSADNCPAGSRARCQYTCRPNPTTQQILVVNHHLLAMDIMFDNIIFGPYQVLVADEAHQLVEGFRSALSMNLTASRIKSILKKIRDFEPLKVLINQVGDKVDADGFVSRFEQVERKIKKGLETLLPLADTGTQILDTKHAKAGPGLLELDEAAKMLGVLDVELKTIKARAALTTLDDQLRVGLDTVCVLSNKLRKLQTVFQYLDSNNAVVTLEKDFKTKAPKLEWRPLDIGKLVGRKLQEIPHTIYTSATLQIGDKGFEYFKTELGLTETAPKLVERTYDSPFDYTNNAKLFIPYAMPKPPTPNAPDYTDWLDQVYTYSSTLIDIFQGDSLVLCTSNQMMNYLYEALNEKFIGTDITIIKQEPGAATTALKKYMDTPHSVLVGVKSFWEGINVKGDKLRLVIIPKLPFPHFYDPIICTKQKRSGVEWDPDLQIPPMVMALKQAVGRLIRTKDDYGVVAILDPRALGGAKLSASKSVLKYGPPGNQKLGLRHILQSYGTTVYHALPIKSIYLRDSFTLLREFVKQHKDKRS